MANDHPRLSIINKKATITSRLKTDPHIDQEKRTRTKDKTREVVLKAGNNQRNILKRSLRLLIRIAATVIKKKRETISLIKRGQASPRASPKRTQTTRTRGPPSRNSKKKGKLISRRTNKRNMKVNPFKQSTLSNLL
jgi:hypothetical protein